MRTASSVVLVLGLAFAATAVANEQARLLEAINAYRSQVQSCEGQASEELPPLSIDKRLILSAGGGGDLQDALNGTGYPLLNAQAISLSGPRDAQTAMRTLQESFCQVLLDPQFIEVGVSQAERDWRIVLARPLLSGRMGDWQAEGRKLLDGINAARAQARQCGEHAFAAAPPLTWSDALARLAETHSRSMANGNYFSHTDRDGRTPGERAELGGYAGGVIGENIAAAQDVPAKVVAGWLSSPGNCATLMNPQYRELGGAYALDPKSDAGIYWTALFGAP